MIGSSERRRYASQRRQVANLPRAPENEQLLAVPMDLNTNPVELLLDDIAGLREEGLRG